MKRASCLAAAALLAAAIAFADGGPPLASVWNIAPSGSADSSGALRFRVKPDEGDPVDISVPVVMGADAETIARGIRRALSSQLRSDRFSVQLGEGSNVLVSDTRGKPHFSMELLNSDVDNLRVAVQSVTPAASPTVPAQAVPAAGTRDGKSTNDAPGDAIPPPAETVPVPGPVIKPPGDTIPVPGPVTPPAHSMPVPGPVKRPPRDTAPVPAPSPTVPAPAPEPAPASPPPPGDRVPSPDAPVPAPIPPPSLH
jgi:hypothetical protein